MKRTLLHYGYTSHVVDAVTDATATVLCGKEFPAMSKMSEKIILFNEYCKPCLAVERRREAERKRTEKAAEEARKKEEVRNMWVKREKAE